MTNEPLSDDEIAEGLRGMATSKSWWLQNHGEGRSKRPEHEIETQRRNLAILVQAANHFQGRANSGRSGSET